MNLITSAAKRARSIHSSSQSQGTFGPCNWQTTSRSSSHPYSPNMAIRARSTVCSKLGERHQREGDKKPRDSIDAKP